MKKVAATLVVTIFGLLGVFAWVWVGDLFEEPPLVYTRLPMPVNPKVVKAGGVILVDVALCNNDDVSRNYLITRKLKNVDGGQDIQLPSHTVTVDPGCKTLTGLPVNIPTYAQGRYVDSGVSYIEGRRKHFVIPWSTEPFLVE